MAVVAKTKKCRLTNCSLNNLSQPRSILKCVFVIQVNVNGSKENKLCFIVIVD